MEKSRFGTGFKWIVTCLFFILYFLYFLSCNRYLLIYHEQIQLFRFDRDYFKEFLAVPGGLMRYTGAFLTQFYLFPTAGALIVTLTGLSIFSISLYICTRLPVPWGLSFLSATLRYIFQYQIINCVILWDFLAGHFCIF